MSYVGAGKKWQWPGGAAVSLDVGGEEEQGAQVPDFSGSDSPVPQGKDQQRRGTAQRALNIS